MNIVYSSYVRERLAHLKDVIASFPLITPFFTHLLGVISHRDGVHACDPEEGKEAMTTDRQPLKQRK